MSKTAILAKITAAEGRRSELVDVFAANIANVQEETGTEIYALHVSATDEVTVWFYELYTDDESLAAHSSSAAMKALGPKLAGLMAGRPEILKLTPIAGKGV